jgi:hypothetical protein
MKQETRTNNVHIFITNFKRNARKTLVYQENIINMQEKASNKGSAPIFSITQV